MFKLSKRIVLKYFLQIQESKRRLTGLYHVLSAIIFVTLRQISRFSRWRYSPKAYNFRNTTMSLLYVERSRNQLNISLEDGKRTLTALFNSLLRLHMERSYRESLLVGRKITPRDMPNMTSSVSS